MLKACNNNCNKENTIIFFIIIIPTIAIFILSYFCIIFLWIFLRIISLLIIIPIIYYLYKKEFCFCLIFTYNIVYIIAVLFLWSFNHSSFAFDLDHLRIWLLFIILEVVSISIILCHYYTKYKDKGAILSQIDEENKIFPFAMSEYINSNINLNNLLENEILNK